MTRKIPKYLRKTWLMSMVLPFTMVAVSSAQAQQQLPAAYYNSSTTVVSERTNGVGEVTINGFNPNTFIIPNHATVNAPNRTLAAVVYDNGPHVNVAGTPDLSLLESTALGMNTLGGNVSNLGGFSFADDFVITAETEITEITAYAYQTGATSTTLNGMYVTIWDGDPSNSSSSVIWGNQTTNVFSSVENINAYRVSETDQGGRTRMVQKVNAAISGLTLNAGTYWLEYSLAGTGTSGPWQPPIVILGQNTTGDALQKTTTGWVAWLDSGTNTPQGLPFQIHGVAGGGGSGCEWTVIVQGTGFGDEVEWELRETGGTVLLSGGEYGEGYYDEQTTTAEGPLEFFITSDGLFGDNTPEYTITTDGNEILTGVLPGGETAIFTDLNCDTGGGGPVVYCIPEGTNSARFINNFSTTGGAENVSNLASGFSAGGYGDFYDTHTVAQELGGDVEFTVDVEGGTAGFRVWVDWNQDGEFDVTEEVAYSSTSYESSHSGSFTVPADALEGDTRMRVVSHWLSSSADVDPCETEFTYGEFEDYKFTVGGGSTGVVYCIPEGTNPARFINNFSTTGGTENVSNLASGFSAGGYGDFYDTHTVAQEQGGDIEFTVDVEGGTAGFRVWVDWNQDGEFDVTEEVAYSSTSYENSHSGSFTVPADALEGDTRMRVVSHWLSTTGDVDPCETEFTYGEFEDYKFTVGGGSTGVVYCIPEGTNTSRFINNFSTTGASQDITNMGSGFSPGGYGDFYDTHTVAQAQGDNVTFSVDVEGGTAGFRVWVDWNQDGEFDTTTEVAYFSSSYENSHTASFAIPADALEGDTRMRIVSHWLSTSGDVDPCETGFTYGEFEDYKFTVEAGTGGGEYCAPFLDCTDNDAITNVTFQEIDNTTTCSPAGYGDYTAMSATVQSAGVYPISVTVGNGWNVESVSVWIDFDNSLTFDEDEFYFIGTGSDEALTADIAIPASAADGDYRMRVRVAAVPDTDATWDMACDEDQGYGETEDYTITVDGVAGVNDYSTSNFTYFPNPMENELNIAADKSIESISVYNLLGQEVLSNVNFASGKVDVSSLSTGTFLFRVTFEGGVTENFKVVKK